MSGRRTLAVVNERAGSGAMADIFRRLEHDLTDAIGDFDVAFTDRVGHATELTREGLAEGYGCIVAGGGDGTLNEVVNGFLDDAGVATHPKAALALLSGGTGGDFRRTARIENSRIALAALAAGKTTKIDIGRVHFQGEDGKDASRFFVNIASFGLSGLVDRYVPTFKQLGGKLAYAGATIRGLWGWKNPRVQVKVDDHFEADFPIVTMAVCNGRYFGGGMMIAPDARLDSGEFEVAVLGDLGRLELLMMTRQIYEGGHIYHPKVVVKRGREVTVDSAEAVFLDVDGEALGRLPARFELFPKALNLIVP